MASILKAQDGRYRAHVFVRGKRKSRVFRTRREADAWAARMETSLRQERDTPPGERYTLADALAKYRDAGGGIVRACLGECAPGYCRLPIAKTKPRDVPLTRKYRERAGLSGFTFHDARHTAATWIAGRMRSSGIPAQQALLDMCRMFGWSNTSRALTYYNPSAADIARRME
ncbi:MAG: hypothetical protein LBF51_02965 [Zoogloeaceae bacterium]|nr:hypothetical protein [Zoogloeaceae bacterium]